MDQSVSPGRRRVCQHVTNHPSALVSYHATQSCQYILLVYVLASGACIYDNFKPLNCTIIWFHQPWASISFCSRLLHPALSPWRSVYWVGVCERGPSSWPWLTRQTPPAGTQPPGLRGQARLRTTSSGSSSSAGESDLPPPWAGSSSSTLLWTVRLLLWYTTPEIGSDQIIVPSKAWPVSGI